MSDSMGRALEALRVGPDDVLVVMIDGQRFADEGVEMESALLEEFEAMGLAGRALVVRGPGLRFATVSRAGCVHAIDCDLDEDCTCPTEEGT